MYCIYLWLRVNRILFIEFPRKHLMFFVESVLNFLIKKCSRIWIVICREVTFKYNTAWVLSNSTLWIGHDFWSGTNWVPLTLTVRYILLFLFPFLYKVCYIVTIFCVYVYHILLSWNKFADLRNAYCWCNFYE